MPDARDVLIVPDPLDRDALDALRASRGWRLCNVVPAADDRPFQMTFLTSDERTWIHFVDDAATGEQYFTFPSESPAGAEIGAALGLTDVDLRILRRPREEPEESA